MCRCDNWHKVTRSFSVCVFWLCKRFFPLNHNQHHFCVFYLHWQVSKQLWSVTCRCPNKPSDSPTRKHERETHTKRPHKRSYCLSCGTQCAHVANNCTQCAYVQRDAHSSSAVCLTVAPGRSAPSQRAHQSTGADPGFWLSCGPDCKTCSSNPGGPNYSELHLKHITLGFVSNPRVQWTGSRTSLLVFLMSNI